MRKLLIVPVLLAALLAGACGGSSDNEALGTGETTVDTLAAKQELQDIAAQARSIISTQLSNLMASGSLDEVSAALDDAQTELDRLAERLDDIETGNSKLDESKDNLHDGLHALSDEVGQIQDDLENGDLQQAVQGLTSSEALTELQKAIESLVPPSG